MVQRVAAAGPAGRRVLVVRRQLLRPGWRCSLMRRPFLLPLLLGVLLLPARLGAQVCGTAGTTGQHRRWRRLPQVEQRCRLAQRVRTLSLLGCLLGGNLGAQLRGVVLLALLGLHLCVCVGGGERAGGERRRPEAA